MPEPETSRLKRERTVRKVLSQSRPECPRIDGGIDMDEKPTDAQDALQTPLEAQEEACPDACLKQGATKASSWRRHHAPVRLKRERSGGSPSFPERGAKTDCRPKPPARAMLGTRRHRREEIEG